MYRQDVSSISHAWSNPYADSDRSGDLRHILDLICRWSLLSGIGVIIRAFYDGVFCVDSDGSKHTNMTQEMLVCDLIH